MFSVSCFSVDGHNPYGSMYDAFSFDDEDLGSWLKSHAAIDRPILISEGDGCIYVFWIDGMDFSEVTDLNLSNTVTYKVGRTSNPELRERQWERQCPSQQHIWFKPVWVERCHPVESLVHNELEKICVVRPHKKCSDCGRVHQEILLMPNDLEIVKKVIVPLIKKQEGVAQVFPEHEV
ncbi:hypothetical protein AAF712_013045 [Marasmius tenuissimus]|uniref:Bacteriophage T5 Orf172 DNA-binding domain-containing protein n=1 Tax=Marasmius tenuissimus TaxID=585030 RepID=A0ABR2ZGS9_9AGAR